jgi:hypothetical protein
MTRPTDETLMAYADGELDGEARAEVERALAEDAELRAALAAQQALRARLAGHYGPIAAEEVPPRLRRLLDSDEAGEAGQVVDLAAARARWQSRFGWPAFAAMAASLAVGVLAGQTALAPGGPVAVKRGILLARGELATALDSQLASAPVAGADYRIRLSFEDQDGRLCRTFEGPAFDGIACRDSGGWAVALTATPAERRATEYRQAASALVAERAQAMMAGEPLDAGAERRARDRGWRRD